MFKCYTIILKNSCFKSSYPLEAWFHASGKNNNNRWFATRYAHQCLPYYKGRCNNHAWNRKQSITTIYYILHTNLRSHNIDDYSWQKQTLFRHREKGIRPNCLYYKLELTLSLSKLQSEHPSRINNIQLNE